MKQYTSLKAIHSVFWRHTLRYLSELILQSATVILMGWLILLFAGGMMNLSAESVNILFLAAATGLIYVIFKILFDWAKRGFFIRTFFHRIEEHHPEISNRASLLVYAEQEESEVDRLGYSKELIAADDSWLNEYMSKQLREIRGYPSAATLISLFFIVFIWGAVCVVEPDFVSIQHNKVISQLWERGVIEHGFKIGIPSSVTLARGDSITLLADLPEEEKVNEGYIHISSRSGWRTYSTEVKNNQLRFAMPSVRQPIRYYFSVEEVLSNQGQVIPLDPPAVQDAEISIVPPQYTGLPQEHFTSLRPVTAPEGSQVTLRMKATSDLKSANFHIDNMTHELEVQNNAFGVGFVVAGNQSFFISMTDYNDMTGNSPVYPVNAVKDATPTVDILTPEPNATIPDELIQTVQVKIEDDYRIEQVLSHFWINDNQDAQQHILLWKYSPEAAEQAGSATSFFLNYKWDLAQNPLFPGDEITYYVEAYDNDAIHGSKAGKSDIHIIRYPSLTDILADIEEQEKTQIEELSGIVEEQKNIKDEIDETVDKISEKMEGQAFDEESPEGFWEEKKELESLKERQQQLNEKAKELEKNLQQFEENITETMPVEEQQKQGFTMETLEKMERVRELMQEIMNEDSQKMMETMENTIQKLSEDIKPEDLEEMQFSVEDFEKQLDRTLSLLENNAKERQLDGLKQMAQEMAQRQDHLQREAQQILEEEQLLAQQEAELNQKIQEELAKREEAMNEQNTGEQQDGSQEAEQSEEQNQQDGENQQGENQDGESQEGEQQNGENQQGENQEGQQEGQQSQEDSSQSSEKKDQEDALEQAKKELEQRRKELEDRKKLLEERQEKLNDDTGNMFETIEQMKEEMRESSPAVSKQLENMQQQAQQKGLRQQMQSAVQQMQQQNLSQAQQHQQKAEQQLREMAEQMQNQMMQMGMQAMQFDMDVITRLIERGLFLSDNLEGLTTGKNTVDSQRAIHRARSYNNETKRIQEKWEEIAAVNPFMSQTVNDFLEKSQRQLTEAIASSQGVKWVALHESRQALIALNDALYTMLEDSQEMQQQMQQQMMQQMQNQDFQQQLQQMLQQQQSLGQQMQQMRQMGEKGEQMMERLRQMAQQQAMIRQKMQEMMQQYRNARQIRNQLQGIYEDMKEVEGMLEEGINNEEVAEKQKRIETRLLEAGTFQEKDEFGKTRKAETAKSGQDANSPEDLPDMPKEERASQAAERPDEEKIPQQYRNAIKSYYIKLNESLTN